MTKREVPATGPAARVGGEVRPAVLFDLDGTLIDSIYQHVVAWHEALLEFGVDLPVWRIHRRIGMSGGLRQAF